MSTKGMSTKELLRKRFDEARAEIAEIKKKSAPLRKKLNEEIAEFEKARLKYKAAKDELLPQIHAIERPALIELQTEVSNLALALNGRRMSRPGK